MHFSFTKDETIRLIHSWGEWDPVNVQSLNYHGDRRGSLSTNLLGNIANHPSLPADAKSFSISMINVSHFNDREMYYISFNLKTKLIRITLIEWYTINSISYILHIYVR